MDRLRNLIIEKLAKSKKKDCNCGCGGCSSERKGPILNENIFFPNPLSNTLKYYIDNNIPLIERISSISPNEHVKTIIEARFLYSRLVLNVNNKDDKKLLSNNK
jgi:hypothetical protein